MKRGIPVKILLAASTLLAVSACAASNNSTSEPWSVVAPPEQRQRVILTGFDCGDNCYLHYRALGEPDGELQTALCTVGPCSAWFEEQAMGAEFIARRATVTLGIGKQYDGGGNVMSEDFPAITSLEIDPVE